MHENWQFILNLMVTIGGLIVFALKIQKDVYDGNEKSKEQFRLLLEERDEKITKEINAKDAKMTKEIADIFGAIQSIRKYSEDNFVRKDVYDLTRASFNEQVDAKIKSLMSIIQTELKYMNEKLDQLVKEKDNCNKNQHGNK